MTTGKPPKNRLGRGFAALLGDLGPAQPAVEQSELRRLPIDLLEANPFHPSLRLHPLRGKLEGLHSVSINLSYRITLELLLQDEQIIPINVGDHDAVY